MARPEQHIDYATVRKLQSAGMDILPQAFHGIAHALVREQKRSAKHHDNFRYRMVHSALDYHPSHRGKRRKKDFAQKARLANTAADQFKRDNTELKHPPTKMGRVGREFPQLAGTWENLMEQSNSISIPLSQLSKSVLKGEKKPEEEKTSIFLPAFLGNEGHLLKQIYDCFYGEQAPSCQIRIATRKTTLEARAKGHSEDGYCFKTNLTNMPDINQIIKPIDIETCLREFAGILDKKRATDQWELKRRSNLSFKLAQVYDDNGAPLFELSLDLPIKSNLFYLHDWERDPRNFDHIYKGSVCLTFLQPPLAQKPTRRLVLPFIKQLLSK